MFNYQARWDRNLPQDDISRYTDPIDVICLMQRGQLIPKSFSRNNHSVEIEKINFTWKDKLGKTTLVFFGIATREGHYEIVFNTATLTWHLHKLLDP